MKNLTPLSRFKTRFGAFSVDGTEYVITSPHTPRPWINVISNGDYGLTFSQTGGGYSWRTHAQLNRITRWNQDLIKDNNGKYLYLRDAEGHVWSATWKPVAAKPERFRCRHGLGYSIVEVRNFGIDSELCVFVPFDEPLEVWKVSLHNRTRKKRTLDLFTYFEWALGQSPDWHREFHKLFIETQYEPQLFSLFASKRLWEVPSGRGHWNTSWPFVAFHAASIRPVGYEADKEHFLGMYGSEELPLAVRKGKLKNHAGNGTDAIGSLHVRVVLPPSGSRTVIFTLGAANSREDARRYILKYQKEENVDAALIGVKTRWGSLLAATNVETPDDAMNLMQNIWLKYQAIAGRLWGRSAYYQTGGAFGFRDQLQDSHIWLVIDPTRTLEQLRLHARHQFLDGSVYHWWHPMTEVGLRTKISDNFLWLPYMMCRFLEETNDFESLRWSEPWLDGGEPATLYEHCTRAISLALERMSPRGLPLIGAGDWNDGLSAVGLDMKGESIWLGHFLHSILRDFSEVSHRIGDNATAALYRQRSEALRSALNCEGWDGEWFYGATKDTGEKLGSRENAEGSIWLNPQTWAIIAGVADRDRGQHLMDVIEKHLEVDIGPLLLRPAYKKPDPYIGYLTRYAPGARENGGVYTHAATWAIVAAAMLGRGTSAFRIYSKLNPIMRGADPLRYCAEPYVTPGNIDGPDSAFHGRGGWTWYTGSAAWLFRAGLEWILGVRPTFDGLVIDPCIPPTWQKFHVRRLFRGATYLITVENPHGVECGVREVWVDRTVQSEDRGPREKIIRPLAKGTTTRVRVVMG